jgi:hypothetical protein
MGNPAGVRAKKREKRRDKHDKRLGIGRYAPKEQPKKEAAPKEAPKK